MKKLVILFILCNLIFSSCSYQNQNNSNISNKEKSQSYLESLPEEYQKLTIPYLKNKSFPGSQITIEKSYQKTAQYDSFIASYQSEGLKIYGLLTKPNSQIPENGFPAVVFLHGYVPPKTYQTTEKYVDYVDYLAINDLVVFKIDLRGHGNSEGSPSGTYFSGDYVTDTLNAYESLKTLDYVNSNKISLWGHSMSGNTILRSLAVKPEIYSASIWAGAVYTYKDMRDYGIQDSSYVRSQNPEHRINDRQKMYNVVGNPQNENSQFWKLVSPIDFLDNYQGKIQIHHDKFDPVVSIKYSQNLQKLLETKNLNFELFEYDGGGHNLNSPYLEQAMQKTVYMFKGQ